MPLVREFLADILGGRTTSLPIGAALIKALKIVEREGGWTVVTPIQYNEGEHEGSRYVATSEWMDKTEVSFEATCTSHSPLFRIPDEVIVRIRSHTFDDGYVGARVDVRSRGHLADDHGANIARVRTFLSHVDW